MKRLSLILFFVALFAINSHAVLKEKDLSNTLAILRTELTKEHNEQERRTEFFKQQNEQVRNELFDIMKKSSQNALMLYSQKSDYVFDLTYACHEATEQFANFKRNTLPFLQIIEKLDDEVVRYDSLVVVLEKMPVMMLDEKAKTDRNVCLTYAVNIRRTIMENRKQMEDYIRYYDHTEKRLKYLNDYANLRYAEIQSNIFKNGGDNYITILSTFRRQIHDTGETISEKYQPVKHSQWDSRLIFGLFIIIVVYGVISVILNLVAFRFFVPKRFKTQEFQQKRTCIMMATTVVTFALILGIIRTIVDQNFIIMASSLLVQYAWLLAVILISLLLRVAGDQIRSAFRIYAPLIFIGFVVIAFRVILVPNDLVDLLFPPLLLAVSLWQWQAVAKHSGKLPKSDVIYTYISLGMFIISTICSWGGYTLLSVQMLIWWLMQLTCVLTITCLTGWMHNYSLRKKIDEKPITKTWMFRFVHNVVLPALGLFSLLISIFWAADVFNLSALTWTIFSTKFINTPNISLSLFSIIQVITLWFVFSYINKVSLDFLRLHFSQSDAKSAESRAMMGKNVIQVVVWGAWALFSLAILHVNTSWLLVITGGLSTGIGFASKEILENIYYGISLMAGRIKVGDWIECDGTKGKVASISYTSTLLEAIDGSVIAFTNLQLFTKNYKNLTKNHGYVLATIPFGVAYGTDMKMVIKLIEDSTNSLKLPYMDKKKKAKVIFYEFGDNSINFKMLCWVDVVKQAVAVSDIMENIYDVLNKNKIEIPFPQRDVHIINKTE